MSNAPDIQNSADFREIAIDRVGISNVVFPIKVRQMSGGDQQVASNVKLFVGLPHHFRGVNMSRFMVSLVEFSNTTISSSTVPHLLDHLCSRLESEDAYAKFEFDYFIDKASPVSKLTAPQNYRCAFTGIKKDVGYVFILEVNIVGAAVCICSKEMSLLKNSDIKIEGELCDIADSYGVGAHNQRSNVRVELISKENQIIWIEEVVSLVDPQFSAPVYPILKRPDEKYVTEQGYKNAKFSEDIARDVQLALEKCGKAHSWTIRVENEESIHSYNAVSILRSKEWIDR